MEKKVEWTWKVEVETRKKCLAVGEACMAIFRPTPGSKGRTFGITAGNLHPTQA